MWKFIIITAIVYQLSAYAAVIVPTQEVALNCVKESGTDEYLIFFDCFLMEVKSSKDQVYVTSTDLDTNSIEAHITVVRLQISGNVNYPEYFPKNLAKTVHGITNFFYKKTPLRFIKREDFKDMPSKLTMLSLEDNEIEDIPFGAFYDLQNLKYLDISGNNLKELDPNLFTKSPLFDSLLAKSND
ncbi:unnamed protein product [Chironomus riparius]|uniref:Uncharacterized protein n=1 Tax=Chironomus riparius TaxID=315576 RepID=A0A9N9S3P5_9DIPT|nr:unnamed protein product [Chironomus riparius]